MNAPGQDSAGRYMNMFADHAVVIHDSACIDYGIVTNHTTRLHNCSGHNLHAFTQFDVVHDRCRRVNNCCK